MGVFESSVIFPETRSGRMKLRPVTWLTNWMISVRSFLSKLSWIALARFAASLGGVEVVAGGRRLVLGRVGDASTSDVCGAMAGRFGSGGERVGCAGCGSSCFCGRWGRAVGFTRCRRRRAGGPCCWVSWSFCVSCASAATGMISAQTRSKAVVVLMPGRPSLDRVGFTERLAATFDLDLDAVRVAELAVDLERLGRAVHFIAVDPPDDVAVLHPDLRIERVGDDAEELEAVRHAILEGRHDPRLRGELGEIGEIVVDGGLRHHILVVGELLDVARRGGRSGRNRSDADVHR